MARRGRATPGRGAAACALHSRESRLVSGSPRGPPGEAWRSGLKPSPPAPTLSDAESRTLQEGGGLPGTIHPDNWHSHAGYVPTAWSEAGETGSAPFSDVLKPRPACLDEQMHPPPPSSPDSPCRPTARRARQGGQLLSIFRVQMGDVGRGGGQHGEGAPATQTARAALRTEESVPSHRTQRPGRGGDPLPNHRRVPNRAPHVSCRSSESPVLGSAVCAGFVSALHRSVVAVVWGRDRGIGRLKIKYAGDNMKC